MFNDKEMTAQCAVVSAEAARKRKANRLVKAYDKACRELAACGPWDINIHSCKAEYKRTRANLLAFMGV
ncbi:hypothetical protein HOT57_gp32 [Pseudomonas phage phCDa]|uniref:Uncharacterized protein n=1 Tax=Pseudomonas phage phCDa TaxID=2268587 RepID=A0A2Z5H9W5_9CAUD|nr:hypothetical protein HOT57_gp32 [Pseudomonas phage phCDa]AXC36476.1 hypothetical protein phCDa_32 [Pseudomonas phage phCDa]